MDLSPLDGSQYSAYRASADKRSRSPRMSGIRSRPAETSASEEAGSSRPPNITTEVGGRRGIVQDPRCGREGGRACGDAFGQGTLHGLRAQRRGLREAPQGTVESLLKDIPKLTSILTYHVVAGKVMAADVVKLTSAKTVQGQSVVIDSVILPR
jgi:hypothetical protein